MTKRDEKRAKLAAALDRDPMMTRYEVADLFRVRPKAVTEWVGRGLLRGIKLPGGQYRFRRSVVMKTLREWRVDDNAAPQ